MRVPGSGVGYMQAFLRVSVQVKRRNYPVVSHDGVSWY